MTQFFIFALLLSALAAAFIVPPLWRARQQKQDSTDRKAANLAIFRDQLAELEREKAEGSLAEADFAQAKSELQRRLLEEVEPGEGEGQAAQTAPARKLAVVMALLVPLLGLLGYGILGNPRALDPEARVARPQMTPEQIEGMVAKLAARMEANPDDPKGWIMLGRSYKSLGRYEDAAKAYSKAEKAIAEDPDLLASYAETIAMANGKGLSGKPTQLIEQALKLDPQHGHSLFLAGAAAMERGDRKAGIAYWESLLPQVEPGSEIDQMLRDGIDKMKQAK
ncbi:MAG: c-type cytochrome biogenesis protein CcmI [Rhodocyclales bacterium]|nr:c-type cytochrome biogenesis protein CcmI [Rhodocyclales bacterium]